MQLKIHKYDICANTKLYTAVLNSGVFYIFSKCGPNSDSETVIRKENPKEV